MNQTMKDELKVIAIGIKFENGESISDKFEKSWKWMEEYLDNLNSSEGFPGLLYFTKSIHEPTKIVDNFKEITALFKSTTAYEYISGIQDRLDEEKKQAIEEIDRISSDTDEAQMSAARPHLAKYIYGYKHLMWLIAKALTS